MWCKKCDYALWNLPSRICPECGEPFKPSEFEFVPNTIEFCCPHCEQPYYGAAEKSGHLEPDEFTCVQCSETIHMDEMVLRPAPGVKERDTKPIRMPWRERRDIGFWRGWIRTVGLALVHPRRLMRRPISTFSDQNDGHSGVYSGVHSGVHSGGWGFFLFSTFLIYSVGMVPLLVFPFAALMRAGPGGAVGMLGIVFGMALWLVGIWIGVVIAAFLWGLIAHGIVLMTGKNAGGMGQTWQAICYSSGANVVTAVPCLGFYFGWIWWVISAVGAVKEVQRVSWGRAVPAVIVPPLLVVMGLVVMLSYGVTRATQSMRAAQQRAMVATVQGPTQQVVDALLSYAEEVGEWPRHGIEIGGKTDDGAITFMLGMTMTMPEDVPVGSGTAMDYIATEEDRARLLAEAELPEGVIAHRLGDFVFTYHGIPLPDDQEVESPDVRLWLVIAWPNPDVNQGSFTQWQTPHVGLVDGTVQAIPMANFNAMLRNQNVIRNENGLPLLPHPRTVTHKRPAVENP